MSVRARNTSGVLERVAGYNDTDLVLSATSKNPIANKAVYAALQQKIEKTVNDLVNYYTTSDTYNKAEVRQLIGAINTLTIEVVATLPTSEISTTTIYFVGPAAGTNTYDEYVYVNSAWVKIGDTNIDLSQYVTNDSLTTTLQGYYTKLAVDAMLDNFYTKTEVDAELDGKQDVLTFDNVPTASSNNPVKSGGVYTLVSGLQEQISKNGAKNYAKNEAINASQQNITFTVNSDKSINAATTAAVSDTWSYRIGKFPMKAGTYILSDGNTGDYSNTCFLQLVNEAETAAIAENQTNHAASFTLASDQTVILRLFYLQNATFSYTFKPMIRLASDTDSTYQPYAETNYQLTQDKMSYADNGILGAKNLLPNNAVTTTINGVTFTVNNDRSITADGTTNADTWLWLRSYAQGGFYLPIGRYIINGSASEASDAYDWSVYVVIAGQSANLATDWGHDANGVEFENTSTSNQLISAIWIRSGAVLNNLLFKPMIRLASDTDDTYQPYAMTNRELTDNAGSPKKTLIRTLANGKITATIPKNLGSNYAQGSLKLIGSNADSEAHVTFCLNSDNTAVSVSKLTNLGSKALTLDSASISGNNLVLEITGVQSYAWVSAEYFMSLSAGASAVQPTWAFTGS